MAQKKLEVSDLELSVAMPYADRTSLLMRTTFCNLSNAERFMSAFEQAVPHQESHGKARLRLKQVVGSILGQRRSKIPQKARGESVYPAVTLPMLTFVVEKADHGVVILGTQVMGQQLAYGRNTDGEVVNTMFTFDLQHIAKTSGLAKAKEIFAEMDAEAVRLGSITLGERSDDLITMTLGGQWRMVACRGKRGCIIAKVHEVKLGIVIKQNKVDANLMREARAIARHYFKDTRTADLFD